MKSRRKRFYEGQAKIFYEGPEPETLIVHFKDETTASNRGKKVIIDGKGVLNNRISALIFQRLNDLGLPTHFIKRLNMREQLIQKVEIIPVQVVVRNVAAGSICTRLGLTDGESLPRSIIEFCYKDQKLGNPLVSEEHITAFGWASPGELDDMITMTSRINDFLCGQFSAIGITLVDFKIEFGRQYDGDMVRVVLADEISPDNCRLWDATTGQKFDKDIFRLDLGDLIKGYSEIAKRLGVLKETNGKPQPSKPVLVKSD